MDYHSPGIQVPDKIRTLLFPYTDEIKASSNVFFKEGAGLIFSSTKKRELKILLTKLITTSSIEEKIDAKKSVKWLPKQYSNITI